MSGPEKLSDAELMAQLSQQGGGSPPISAPSGSPTPPASAPDPYPAQGGYQPNPAQSQSAWSLYHAGKLTGGDGTTPTTPMFAVPGRPAPKGNWIIDEGGTLRQADENDDGASQAQASSLSDHDIMAELANSDPNMSSLEDWARSGVTQAQKDITSTLAAPNTVARGAADAADWLINKTVALSGGKGLSDEEDRTLKQLIGNYADRIGPSQAALDERAQSVAGPYHEPQSVGGRATQTLVSMAPGALLPAEGALGGLATRVSRVALPAVGSEVAGELTHGTPLEPWARVGGGVFGGGVQGLGEAIANAPEVALGNGLKGIGADQIGDAADLMRRGNDVGVKVSPLEALAQVGGGSANRVQHYVENSAYGAPLTQSFFAERPGQMSAAISDYADALAPPSNSPGLTAKAAQGAADARLSHVRQAINGMAKPYYDGLENEQAPLFVAALKSNPSYGKALSGLRGDPELNGPIAHLPDDNLSVVNETVKKLDADIAAADPSPQNPTGNHQLVGLRTAARNRADLLASILSDNWRNARGTVALGREAWLDPLDVGPVGKIARTGDIGEQTGALYPPAPPEGAAQETGRAVEALNLENPSVARDLTRQHIVNTANESTQNLVGGQNQWGGAKWVAQTMGNPEQRGALQAGLTQIDPGLKDRLDILSEVLAATGKRLPTGSQTQFNKETADLLNLTPAPIHAASRIIDPLEWGSAIDKAVGGALYRRNVGKLADFMTNTDPEAAEQYMLRAKRSHDTNGMARALLTFEAGAGGSNQK